MYLLFDVGASKMRLAVSRDGETFETPKVVASPDDETAMLASFAQTAQELLGNETPVAIAGGVTRKHENLKTRIAGLFACASYIENDTAMCGLGEALSGAGRGADIVAYVTISTGVGGVKIVNGRIDENSSGFEPGYQIISIDGENKTLEELISGRHLAQRLGKSPKEITDQAVWDGLAAYLAIGLNNLIVDWSPELVVLGGSMITGTPAISLAATEKRLREILTVFPNIPKLKLAELGDFGGLHGALHFLRQKLQN